MTHPSNQTNGASLEDCHTNFFALTDLCGIKWRKLVWSDGGPCGAECLDEPVLRSYARCLAADILCVWRRVSAPQPQQMYDLAPQPATQPPPLSLAAAKELWIFWYGEEPDLSDLVVPELLSPDGEQGSWESGLSYECRSLLFKALHNLIERCLLSRDFVRLGKWFVQPYEGPKKHPSASSTHLSFSFAFFVHGESTVCASVDVRQHPTVRRLSRAHLLQAQASSTSLQVILAPFGLAGSLTGQTFKATDANARLLDDWAQFYPLDKGLQLPADCNGINPVVEVIVGGIKMKYPACFVMVTDMDEIVNSAAVNGAASPTQAASPNGQKTSSGTATPISIQTPPPSPPVLINSRVPQPGPFTVSVEHTASMQKTATSAQILPERVWQECVLGGPPQPQQPPCADNPAGNWDFVDPTRRANCTCAKCRKYVGPGKTCGSKSGMSKAPKGARGRVPFHRRSPEPPADDRCPADSYNQGGPPSYPRTQESLAIPSVGSPPSAAPSPLPNPHSQPASVPPGDQAMPTLSPQPPTVAPSPLDKVTSTATPSEPPKSSGSLMNSPAPPREDIKVSIDSVGALSSKGGEGVCSNSSSGNGLNEAGAPTLKRPLLASREYERELEEEDQYLELLYDYTTLDAWLDHPVKKFKPDSKEHLRSKRLAKSGDLYALYNQNGVTNNNGELVNNNNINNVNSNVNNQSAFIKQEIKQEPGSNCAMETEQILNQPLQTGMKRPGDPYEFDEEGGQNVNMDGFKRGANPLKEEPKDGKKCVAGNLFTSEGLQPSYKDLDQIFDNSDDTSSDEALQVTPPDSNTSSGGLHDDSKTSRISSCLGGGSGGSICGGGNGTGNTGTLRPEDLVKMFPTPPSLEHNPIASPGGQMDGCPLLPDMTTDLFTGVVRIKQEIYPNMGSPQDEDIDDWSFVFKPPLICKMVGSSKYAPLTNLPSQSLNPVVLPNHCVYKPSWITQHIVNTSNNTNTADQKVSPITPKPQQNQQQPPQQPQQPSQQQQIPPNMQSQMPTPQQPSMMGGGSMGPGSTALYPPSPLHGAGFRQPPPPYELPSPATSTASSYLNKNLNSVEPIATPNVTRTPEASSLLVNMLLADTSLNIFRDHNFDSCTLCVCNAGPKVVGNIRGADAGVYLLNSSGGVSAGTLDRMGGGTGGSSVNAMMMQNPGSPFPNMGVMGGAPPPYGSMLSPQHHQQQQQVMDEDSIRCSCGFSAVVNRRLSHRSGLFYEDELEITGLAEDPSERKKGSLVSYLLSTTSKLDATGVDREPIDAVPQSVIELVREQCVMVQSTSNSLCRSARSFRAYAAASHPYSTTVNMLEFTDGNEVTCLALEQGRQAAIENGSAQMSMCKMEEMRHKPTGSGALSVHRWPFLRACGPQCNQDIVRVMNTLQPLLQEAIQKKCQTRLWEAPYTVKGPLTWRQFHRLAGRGTDDRCEPQPIPSVIVGHEKDWLSLSPYALQHWDRLLLEPYSYARDVAYIVVAPDNEAILPRVRTFFRDLSTAYEMCRLGRHSPITKVLRDGILRVGKAAKLKLGNEPVEDWFSMLGESETTDMLKLYAQVCKHHLAPHLLQVPMDKTLLDPPESSNNSGSGPDQKLSPSPRPPPTTPDPNQQANQQQGQQGTGDKAPSTPKSEENGTGNGAVNDAQKDAASGLTATVTSTETQQEDDDRQAPNVVVYLVEPFSMGCDRPELQRLACLALLRCFQGVLAAVPENIRSNISVQIISQESIVELGKSRERARQSDHMRALALSVFSQCRRLLVHSSNVKSLTGFGTAAMADVFLKSKDEKNRAPYKLYTPPYVLAPLKEKAESAKSFGQPSTEMCSVLYLSYCLSEDQSWLLAVATDERGEIFETVTINIDIPNRSRRKKASARRIGLQKLMDFILGVMSQSVKPWRLVVGRLGRIGHGELKGWSWLLSKKSLLKASRHLKDICTQCSLMYPGQVPCILSACLVSLEPDSALRLMPDQFTPDERFSQASVNCQLSTPQDVSCTHILVFPTSATTQSSQTAFQEQHINEPDLGDEDIFNALNDDMPDGIEGMNDFSDIFNVWPDQAPGGGQSPNGSPRREESSRPGSPSCGVGGNGRPGSPYGQCGAVTSRSGEQTEEVGTLLQQPLALGYLVSTAPTGRMPRWFWASCPHLEGVCPAFLKNALHLHSPTVQQSSDDLLQQAAVTSHPLDSQYTTDVLRYVLEGYNALSWLALDSNTQDRLSCLPVHVQVLVQLYHMTAALL